MPQTRTHRPQLARHETPHHHLPPLGVFHLLSPTALPLLVVAAAAAAAAAIDGSKIRSYNWWAKKRLAAIVVGCSALIA